MVCIPTYTSCTPDHTALHRTPTKEGTNLSNFPPDVPCPSLWLINSRVRRHPIPRPEYHFDGVGPTSARHCDVSPRLLCIRSNNGDALQQSTGKLYASLPFVRPVVQAPSCSVFQHSSSCTNQLGCVLSISTSFFSSSTRCWRPLAPKYGHTLCMQGSRVTFEILLCRGLLLHATAAIQDNVSEAATLLQ